MSNKQSAFEQLKNMTSEQQQNVVKASMAIKALKDLGIIERIGLHFSEENAKLYAAAIDEATAIAMKFDLPTLFDSDEEAEQKIEKAEAERSEMVKNCACNMHDEDDCQSDEESECDETDAEIDQIIAAINRSSLNHEQKDTEIFKAVTSHAMINMHERMDKFDSMFEEVLNTLQSIATKLQPKTGN